MGRGVLVAGWDIEAGADDDFNSWHLGEHVPERIGVPGFVRGRRYAAQSAYPKYFTLYEADSVEVFSSPQYVERLNNPTPWTRRVLATFRNTMRTVCQVTMSIGSVDGGAIATLELAPSPAASASLRTRLARNALPALVEHQGITAVHLLEPDYALTRIDTEEQRIRRQPDEMAGWVILVEGTSVDIVSRACRELVAHEPHLQQAVHNAVARAYQLSFQLMRARAS